MGAKGSRVRLSETREGLLCHLLPRISTSRSLSITYPSWSSTLATRVWSWLETRVMLVWVVGIVRVFLGFVFGLDLL